MSDLVVDSLKIEDKIFKIIDNITPYDQTESKHIVDTLNWIKSAKSIFRISKPDNPNKHLVSYFVVFDYLENKVLLVNHKKAGLWLPSGGHVEVGEDPVDTVKRECLEELNIKAEFYYNAPIFITQTVTVGLTAGHTDVSLWYVIKGNSRIKYNFDQEEFSDIKWFGLEQIPYGNTDPHMKRFINKFHRLLHQK